MALHHEITKRPGSVWSLNNYFKALLPSQPIHRIESIKQTPVSPHHPLQAAPSSPPPFQEYHPLSDQTWRLTPQPHLPRTAKVRDSKTSTPSSFLSSDSAAPRIFETRSPSPPKPRDTKPRPSQQKHKWC